MDSPYPAAYLDSLFAGLPTGVHREALLDQFLARPSSLLLVALTRRGAITTAAPAASFNSTRGRAAWRRFQRAKFYLQRAAATPGLLPPEGALLLLDMNDTPEPPASPHERRRAPPLPLFAASGTPCGRTIPLPIPLKGFGTNDLELLLARAAPPPPRIPWDRRDPTAVWRGAARASRACAPPPPRWDAHPRAALVNLSRAAPRLGVDAGFTSVGKSPRGVPMDRFDRRLRVVPPLPFARFAEHKFVLELDGSGYQASLAAKMLLGSAVLSQRSRWPLWFQPLLEHETHLVLFRADLSDLPEQLRLLRQNDEVARLMGAMGADLVRALLEQRHLEAYVRGVLSRWVKLFSRQALFRALLKDPNATTLRTAPELLDELCHDAQQADAAARRVAAQLAAGAAPFVPTRAAFCRGARRDSESAQPDEAACLAHCRPRGCACFHFARGRCRWTATFAGLNASRQGYTAWVRTEGRRLAAPREERRAAAAEAKGASPRTPAHAARLKKAKRPPPPLLYCERVHRLPAHPPVLSDKVEFARAREG
ncbi:hypothetical protein AB1Y20_004963 [Prymnesium parvum]|uniref:Glycosyl transferase CAP10 domain-containing protein n=1 Tax=Prymnesium parvum TaxID=97485 RepID=A0AB34J4V9_PRYPA